MRLIDADALKESFRDSFDACYRWEKEAMDSEIQIRADASRNTFLEAILRTNDMPTVEQPQIVRCKDCKHRPIKTGEDDNDVEFPDAKCICKNPDDDWFSWYPDDDWFCGNGERKDGDADG